MAKPQKRYVCQSCGSVAHRWAGQCGDCSEWNTLVEEAGANVTPFQAKHNLQGGGRAIQLVGLDSRGRAARAAGERDRRARPGAGRRVRRGVGDADRRRSGDRQVDAAAAGGGADGAGGAVGRLCLGRGGGGPGAVARAAAGAGRRAGAAGGGDLGARHPDDAVERHAARPAGDRFDPDDAFRPDRGRAGHGQPGARRRRRS